MEARPDPAHLRGRDGVWKFLVMLSLWGGAAAFGRAFRDRAPRYSGDEGVWASVAHVPTWSEAWRGLRPPLVPLVYEALHHDPELIVRVQLVFSVLAFSVFAVVLSGYIRESRSRFAATAFVFAWLLVDPNDFSWSVRSEAISHSLLWLTLAGFLWFLRAEARGLQGRWARALALFFSAALFSWTRDNAAYVLLGLGVALPLLLLLSRGRARVGRGSWGMALFLILLGLLATHETERSGRHVAPLTNLLVTRIAKNEASLDVFERAGLPDRGRIVQVSRKGLHVARRIVLRAPEFQSVRDWLEQRGPRAYRGLLLRNAGESVRDAAPWFARFASADLSGAYGAKPEPAWARLRKWAGDLSPERVFPVTTAALAGLIVLGGLRWSRSPSSRSLSGILGLLLLLAWGTSFLAYHGDAMELERHGAMVSVFLRALIAVLCVLGLVVWGERRRGRDEERGVEAPQISETRASKAGRALFLFGFWGAPALVGCLVLSPFPWTEETARGTMKDRRREELAVLFDGSIRERSVCLPPGSELGFTPLKSGRKSFRLFAALDGPEPRDFEVVFETKSGTKKVRPRAFEAPHWTLYAGKLPAIRSGKIRVKSAPLCLTEIRLE